MKSHRKLKITITIILGCCVLFVVAGLIYLGNYYHADEKAKLAIQGNEKVSVSEINEGYLFDGVALLASYTTTKLKDDMKVYSIYGSEDKCLSRDSYVKYKDNLPSSCRELVIGGGNHAQFGNYGHQDGDGTATISAEEQQNKTVETISELVKK